jgi:hypothetical protein
MDTPITTPVNTVPPASEASPVASAPAMPPVKAEKKSWGPMIAIILILAFIIVGAFYAWGKRIANDQQPTATVTQ